MSSCSQQNEIEIEKGEKVIKKEESWRKIELQIPEEAIIVNSLTCLADGTIRIGTVDQNYENALIWDSNDKGETWISVDTDMGLTSEYGNYHYSGDGRLYIYENEKLILASHDKTESQTFSTNEGEVFYKTAISGNTLVAWIKNMYNGQTRLEIYNLQTMESRQLDNTELLELLNSAYIGSITLNSSGDTLYIAGEGIARYNFKQDSFSYLLDQEALNNLINPINENALLDEEGIMTAFSINDSEDIFFFCIEDPMKNQSKLFRCELGRWEDESQITKEQLRVYSLYGGMSIRQAALLFQEKYPNIEILFETGYTGNDGVTLSDAIRTLNTELMTGEGPDILVLDGLPSDSYVEKGILEDVSSIVEQEKEKLFYNIISATNDKETIYKVPTSFSVPIILGDAEIVNTENRKELMEVLEEKYNIEIPFTTPENLSGVAGNLFITSNILRETVDEKDLADYYNDLTRLAEHILTDKEHKATNYYNKLTYWAEGYPSVSFDQELDVYFDKAQVEIDTISRIETYMKILSICKEKGLSYQYLNRENGKQFIAQDILGINRTGKHIDVAKQFLKYYLSEGGQNVNSSGFSVIRKDMEETEFVSENRNFVGSTSRKDDPNQVLNMYTLTYLELQEIITFFEDLDTMVKDDVVVLQKIMEQADACIFEGKNPESAAKDICSEVNLYLSE